MAIIVVWNGGELEIKMYYMYQIVQLTAADTSTTGRYSNNFNSIEFNCIQESWNTSVNACIDA